MNTPAKVMHVIIGLEKGGAEMMLHRLIEASLLNESKIRHAVISLTDLGYHGALLRQRGVDVYALNMSGPIGLVVGFLKLIILLTKFQPKIVQTWMVHSDLLGGLAAKVASVPYVIWGVRTTDYSVESRSTRAVRWLCAMLSSFVPDKIVCAAQASLENSAQVGYDVEKLVVIPNGFDVQRVRAHIGTGVSIRQECGLDASHVVVGCMGRYNIAKDHANFVRAAALVAANNAECRFLMVGRDLQPSNIELINLIDSTGYAERFYLLGERSDPFACLDAMDIFVLSSCTEGFPNVLGEAMVLGLPCVTTDVGDAAVLLGDAGLLVPPRDCKALADAIGSFLTMTKIERQDWGYKGQIRVVNQYSIETSTHRFNELYEKLMAKA